ncbi:hypothetical protein ACFPOH_00875 [Ureibacillus suwonensis]|uniref:Calcineurin-like phosphoesterase domain-containing protein n=1 Tax=Ureibacillus suwonensis TaxID=313007 RepID=A0ABW0R6E3_9BACL
MFINIDKGVDIVGDIHACFDEWLEMLDRLGYQKNEQGLYVHPKGRKMVSPGDVMSRGPKSIETMVFFLKHRHLMYMIDSNHGWKIARWLDGRKVQLKHGDEKVEEEFIEFEREKWKRKNRTVKKRIERHVD